MSFAVREEHEELRRTVRDFLTDLSPPSEVRRLMATTAGYDPAVWTRLGTDLGVLGLAIPEQYGGAGYGFTELGLVLEEAGRALLCAPLFASAVLAASTLLALDDEPARHDYLPGIATGETIATLALTEASGRWDAAGVTATATRHSLGWTLDGTKTFVLDGHTASLLLVAARTGAGISVFAVDGDAPGLRRTALATLDQTRRQARLDLTATPARLLGTEGQGWPAIARALDRAAVGLAAEQVGGAQVMLDMAVDYAKTRVQFGRPIGSFQAIKHSCADLLVEVESARSAAYYGLGAVDADEADLPRLASLAKAYCSDAYFHAAAENIQIHGGIGFTWEHPAHLYFKRAKSSQLLLGDPAYHRARLADWIVASA